MFWKHALLLFTEQQIIMNIKYTSLQNTKYQTNPSFYTEGDQYQYQTQISNKLYIFAQGVIMKTEREDNWENTNSEVVQKKMHFFKSFSFNFLSWMTTKKKYCFSDAFLECPHFKGMICVLFQDTLSKSLESATTARYYEQT